MLFSPDDHTEAEHAAWLEDHKKIDEHGNPMPCMYRIAFPDAKTESYFYTEKTYRRLEERIVRLVAALERVKSGLCYPDEYREVAIEALKMPEGRLVVE